MTQADLFKPLPDGIAPDLVAEFVARADDIRARGFTHYSARTIGEYIRFHRHVEKQGEFKVNNNVFPTLARYYMSLRGCPDFFSTREHYKNREAA